MTTHQNIGVDGVRSWQSRAKSSRRLTPSFRSGPAAAAVGAQPGAFHAVGDRKAAAPLPGADAGDYI